MHWIVNLQQPWELGPPGQQTFTVIAFDPANRDLSSQVVAIPMTSFGMLINSPDSEFQRISTETLQAPGASSDPSPAGGHEIPVAMPTSQD